MPDSLPPDPTTASKWKEPSPVGAVMAAVLSAIALATSVRSCSVSERALDLAASEFQSSRALVLKGELTPEQNAFKLSPLDQAFLLQQVRFRFPKDIGSSNRPSLPPDFRMPISSELFALEKFVASRVKPESGTIKVKLEARVPFLIDSVAAVKGVLVSDLSLYAFTFGFTVFEDPNQMPQIRPLGIFFVRRLDRDEGGEKELESAWQASKG